MRFYLHTNIFHCTNVQINYLIKALWRDFGNHMPQDQQNTIFFLFSNAYDNAHTHISICMYNYYLFFVILLFVRIFAQYLSLHQCANNHSLYQASLARFWQPHATRSTNMNFSNAYNNALTRYGSTNRKNASDFSLLLHAVDCSGTLICTDFDDDVAR